MQLRMLALLIINYKVIPTINVIEWGKQTATPITNKQINFNNLY